MPHFPVGTVRNKRLYFCQEGAVVDMFWVVARRRARYFSLRSQLLRLSGREPTSCAGARGERVRIPSDCVSVSLAVVRASSSASVGSRVCAACPLRSPPSWLSWSQIKVRIYAIINQKGL